jgi:hypothetical protein
VLQGDLELISEENEKVARSYLKDICDMAKKRIEGGVQILARWEEDQRQKSVFPFVEVKEDIGGGDCGNVVQKQLDQIIGAVDTQQKSTANDFEISGAYKNESWMPTVPTETIDLRAIFVREILQSALEIIDSQKQFF